MFIRWVVLCAAAEFGGIAAAALWYGAVNVWVGEPEQLLPRIGAWALMSLAAVPEGVVLGGLQAVGVRWFVPTVSAPRWIAATIAVGFLGWGVGTMIPMFFIDETAVASGPGPSLVQTALFSGAFGILAGAVFGAFQMLALPRDLGHRRLWVLWNAAGWGIGLPCIYIAAEIASDQQGWSPRILLWALGGLAAGASLGVATGLGLRLMRK